MHEHDSWAGVNGQVTKGRRLQMWMSFQDCLELHKLTVFSADAAKRQRFYIQQAVGKPQRATLQQYILQMGVLNDHVRHLPTLKDSPKAVPTTKKGNIPFGEAPLNDKSWIWQNLYYRVIDKWSKNNILYHWYKKMFEHKQIILLFQTSWIVLLQHFIVSIIQ